MPFTELLCCPPNLAEFRLFLSLSRVTPLLAEFGGRCRKAMLGVCPSPSVPAFQIGLNLLTSSGCILTSRAASVLHGKSCRLNSLSFALSLRSSSPSHFKLVFKTYPPPPTPYHSRRCVCVHGRACRHGIKPCTEYRAPARTGMARKCVRAPGTPRRSYGVRVLPSALRYENVSVIF